MADGGPARRARGAGRRAVGLHAVPQGRGPVRARAQHRGLRAVHRPAGGRALRQRRGARVGPRPRPRRRRRSTPPTPRSASSSRSTPARTPGSSARPASPRRDRRGAAAGRRARRRAPCTSRAPAAWSRVATATLSPRATLLRGHRVSAVLARGRRLFVQDGAVATLDAASGRVLAAHGDVRAARRARGRGAGAVGVPVGACGAARPKASPREGGPRGARPGRPAQQRSDRCRRTTLRSSTVGHGADFYGQEPQKSAQSGLAPPPRTTANGRATRVRFPSVMQ